MKHFEFKHDTRICITRALLQDVQYKTTFRPATPLGGARSHSSPLEMLVLVCAVRLLFLTEVQTGAWDGF